MTVQTHTEVRTDGQLATDLHAQILLVLHMPWSLCKKGQQIIKTAYSYHISP